ncbi:MAG: hypothetical protein QOJ27_318 [Sphingomonadales bacterium]|nr:hypothetical protein [Sphingomonadales bacterium]
MDPHLPLSVRIGPRPPGIVVDATFALSPMGLLATMALARSAHVWLPRALYTLLDNDSHYRANPDQMGGETWLDGPGRDELLVAMAGELEPWRWAWQNGRLSSRVHWIADAQYESALPDRQESGLLPRFESCCAALDSKRGGGEGISFARPLDECARDVIALAAALQPETTYILTIAGPAPGQPPLCRFAEPCGFKPILWAGPPDWVEAAFAPAFAPLAACSDWRAAIVQIAAPVILALHDGWSDSDWDNDEPPEAGDEGPGDLWRHARALWRPLAATEAAA